jgi:hypothetical protein
VADDYPNIVPPNNLRLPDALTVRHGSGPAIGRFVLAGDRAARAAGIHLRLRTDFSGLLDLNRKQIELGNWYPLLGTFNPEGTDINETNGFWVAGENADGEIVCCSAARIYSWSDTTLEEQVAEVFFGRDTGQPRSITAPAAKFITGVSLKAGATWIHPQYRKRELPQLLSRMARAYGMSRWPLDWTFAYIPKVLIDKGVAAAYGAKHISYSIFFPGSRFGEIGLSYTSAREIYDDLGGFTEDELSDPATRKFAPAEALGAVPGESGISLMHEVTRTPSDGVLHGSSSRS